MLVWDDLGELCRVPEDGDFRQSQQVSLIDKLVLL